MDPSPCLTEIDKASVFPDQPSIEISDPCLSAVSQLPPQSEIDTSRKYAHLTPSDDAAATSRPDQSGHPLPQSDLMTLLQLHCHVRNFKHVLKTMNIMIRDIRKEIG